MGLQGILYVIATPIGNLGDITFRAIDILKEADIVVAESTARAMKLFTHYGIKKTIVTISSYNEERRAASLVRSLKGGKNIALITSAGTPCISDPGSILVNKCVEENIEVCPIPGASAVTSLVSISGLFADRFLFYGFLPLKKGKRKKALQELASLPYPIVFYESPRRIEETLGFVLDIMGDRKIAVVKEMTKVFETTYRGTVNEVIDSLSADEKLGEYAFIVAGHEK
ncbi:MAG: 16S rRNA (cytidine(1402)-2'-O)-methyltransferase [Syntrophorhabdaceae bacterium]|nr:16S rRNA (cytidine(1402)-2'-O)-methyltransferase [Syntrophorhabdaceae bacterium]MDD4194919.1 16S rRNA (cytidine(1402)-2'-O)-methyltransferase [Syntrophorhabdaceae bacterium]